MASLAFQAILATGHREMGESLGPEKRPVYDVLFKDIDLPGFVDHPALVVLAVRNVDYEKNFITINAPPEALDQSYDEAMKSGNFVWRVLPNPSDSWILQLHQIDGKKLKTKGNVLGIHSRDVNGEHAGPCDTFSVARLFVLYYASQK